MTTTQTKLTIKDVIKQLKADLIGKDSYRGVTLTYSWLANQFGHISLGFIPTIVLYKIKNATCCHNYSAMQAATTIAIMWFLFELYNFLAPLLFTKKAKSYVFAPSWFNVAFDTFTDVMFFALGSFVASILYTQTATNTYIILIILAILIYPIAYWFATKMLIQYARYPMQFRLSQWTGNISKNDKEMVASFINMAKQNTANHLLVFGADRTGKSSISIGIATEFSIKENACSYYTCLKWLSTINMSDEEIRAEEKNEMWSWRKANCLVIDDINLGNTIPGHYLTPDYLYSVLAVNENNINDIKTKNIVWVMGAAGVHDINITSWINMLKKIGINTNQIFTIKLF
jgi:hypothetical protein